MMNKKKIWLLSLIVFFCIIFSQINKFPSNANNPLTGQKFDPEIQAIINKYQPQNPPRGDVRLLVISDLNGAYGSTEYDEEVHLALKTIPFWQPDLILCSGDMIAGQKPSLTPQQIRAMWQGFDRHIAQPMRKLKIPFGFTIGNHDASSAVSFDRQKFLFQQERDLAVEYWQNPNHDPRLNFVDRHEFPFYYTFKQNDIFFLVWDGSSSRIPQDKLAWVEKSLGSPEAQQAKMKVVIGHLPLYAVAEGRDYPGEVLNNAEQLRKLLEKHHVHTYISGHHHAYYPGHKGDLQLLHTGALGGGSRFLINDDQPPRKTITVVDINFDDPQLTTYTTYALKNFALINHQQLPRLLMGHNGMIMRRDVQIQDLSPEEKMACAQQEFNVALCQE
jgi:hypothetical protein